MWSHDQRLRAYTAVIAHLMWLLMTFIGEHLVVGTVREVWPAVPFGIEDSTATRGQ
jgi:hypothetical protein